MGLSLILTVNVLIQVSEDVFFNLTTKDILPQLATDLDVKNAIEAAWNADEAWEFHLESCFSDDESLTCMT